MKWYRSGNPFKTGAILNYPQEMLEIEKIEKFKFLTEKDKTVLLYEINKTDYIYGLGETLGTLNKRGKKYRLYAADDPNHTPEKESLYGSHPFVIVDGINPFGFLIDYPGEIIFDVGYENKNILKIEFEKEDFDIFIFETNIKKDIIKEFLELTGKPHIFPKWAFGFQQSRWSYPDKEAINKVASNFREKDIPCDAIYMDIDYMDNFKIFTFNDKSFEDFENFAKDIYSKGFKLVPIIDPGVKIEKNYYMYEEGVKNNYFCKKETGEDFIAAIWPGLSHFPDFMQEETRKWWGEKYEIFTRLGINSFWNDMNEPSIFFTDRTAGELMGMVQNVLANKDKEINPLEIQQKMMTLSNNVQDYKNMYHEDDEGNKINHHEIHNLYGHNMLKSSADGLSKLMPEKRHFLLTRSSYIGTHRYGTLWMGDNMSWWEHMIVNIRMLQSLNMCGYFYTGADIGGFGCNASPELVIRWMQLGIFSPLYRNHSAWGTRNQEPWAFDEDTENIMKNTLKIRYSLITYAYSEYMKSVKNSKTFITPLFMEYNTARAKETEDQFLYGDSIMVTPIYIQNAKGRYVHLPEDKWLFCLMKSNEEKQAKIYESGDHYINVEMEEIPFFIKENSLVPFNESMNYVGEKEITEITVLGFVTDKAFYEIYDDEGTDTKYAENYSKLKIEVRKKDEEFLFSVNKEDFGDYESKIKIIHFEIYDEKNILHTHKIEI